MENKTLENIQKAQRCADLLAGDLRDILNTCAPLTALVIAPEIKAAADINNRLKQILTALGENTF